MKFCALLLLFTLTLCQGTESQYSGYVNERHLPNLRPYEPKVKYDEGKIEQKVGVDKGKEAEEYKRQEVKNNEKQDEQDYRKQRAEIYKKLEEEGYINQEAEGYKRQEGERHRNKEAEVYGRQEEKEYRNKDSEDYVRQALNGYRRPDEEDYKKQVGEGYIRLKEKGYEDHKDQYELYYGPNFGGLEGRRFDGYGPGEYKNEGGYERGYKEQPLILGRFGLGFDRRTASSIGLQEPLTLQQLRTVGQGYYGRLNRKGGPIPIEYYDYL